MSRFQRIRDFIQAHGPSTVAEISAGIGHEGPRIRVSFAIGTMVADGWLENVTPGKKPATFALLRTEKIIRPKPDADTKRRTKQDRAREREQAKRTLTPAQYRAWLQDCKQRSQDQKAAAQAEALRIQRLTLEIRAANSARAAARRKKEEKARPRKLLDAPIVTVDTQEPPRKTSADFVAEGGVIQRLRDGEVSKHNRLHRIGARA